MASAITIETQIKEKIIFMFIGFSVTARNKGRRILFKIFSQP